MVGVTLLGAVTLSASHSAYAQNYPNRDMTFIVPFAPGGSSDPPSRQFSAQMKKILRVNINVENKPGGSATIGTGAIVRSKPDGYTIGLATNGSLAFQPLVNDGLAYKTVDDYQPLVKLFDQYVLLTVRADAPWKNFGEFMAEVRKNPGKIRASVAGLGSTTDLALQMFNKVAGVKIKPVPFTGGGGEAMIALLGGRVEVSASQHSTTIGQERAGKVRVLAVLRKGKDSFFPGATPAFSTGEDGTLSSANYVIAPKGMPKEVLDKLVTASLQAVRSEEYLAFLKTNGYVSDPIGPEELREEIIRYTRSLTDLVKFMTQK
jgi:tripartite-type tricarboxylate transporter receptor subunit TctC